MTQRVEKRTSALKSHSHHEATRHATNTATRSAPMSAPAVSCTHHMMTLCAAMCLSGEILNMRHSMACMHRSAMHSSTSANAKGTASCSAPISDARVRHTF